MKSDVNKLLKKHDKLVQSDGLKVTSHVQTEKDDWIINTVMVEGCDAPFKFRRQQAYKNLKGARVNLTYYPAVEMVAGIELEVMNVVRIKVS
jgi:hypothetical protein